MEGLPSRSRIECFASLRWQCSRLIAWSFVMVCCSLKSGTIKTEAKQAPFRIHLVCERSFESIMRTACSMPHGRRDAGEHVQHIAVCFIHQDSCSIDVLTDRYCACYESSANDSVRQGQSGIAQCSHAVFLRNSFMSCQFR